MTVMANWDHLEDMRAAQDDMFRMLRGHAWHSGHHYGGPTGSTTGRQAWAPTVDISERTDAYVVAAELPGVKTDDVEITFEDGLLTIQGERHHADATEGEKVHRTERRYGAFCRSITMPNHVDADKIEASTEDGVLQVLVPKAKDVRAKRIEVRAGNGRTAKTGAVKASVAKAGTAKAGTAKAGTAKAGTATKNGN
jgi:HSP20 family protein